MSLKLSEIVPWGRSMREYAGMFALSEGDLRKNILGCADGPASFNAEMTERGGHVISCDPIYQFEAEQIRERFEAAYPIMIARAREHPELYLWHTMRDLEELGKRRRAATEKFLADFPRGGVEGRYVAASLPCLPFAAKQFELAVCAHLLFTYDDHLSLDFHLEALRELARVAHEVRIYPLISLDGQKSKFLEPVVREMKGEIVRVAYHFQRGANEMMVIRGT